MKYILITILSFYSLIPLHNDRNQTKIISQNVQVTSCPEQRVASVFYLNAILTNPTLHAEKQLLGFDTPEINMNQEELLNKPDLPEFLTNFWQERGVELMTDPIVCGKIAESLDQDERNKQFLRDYNRVFYKINNRYLILYHFKKRGFTERRSVAPPQIMDEKFNIIGELEI
jgi:hypothetical protein